MRRILPHILFLAVALAITLVAFNFWGKFSGAMGNLYKDKPAAANGEVTVGIIPAGAPKPDCDKKHPCP